MTPFEDRYKSPTIEKIKRMFSEENYMKHMYALEVDYFLYSMGYDHADNFGNAADRYKLISMFDYREVKKLEKSHKHDVVSIIYHLIANITSSELFDSTAIHKVHFGLTSQDIVSVAHISMWRATMQTIYNDDMLVLKQAYTSLFSGSKFIERTHGQEANVADGSNLSQLFVSRLEEYGGDEIAPSRFGNGSCGDRSALLMLGEDSYNNFMASVEKIRHAYHLGKCQSRQTDYYPYITDQLHSMLKKVKFLKNEMKNLWAMCSDGQLIQDIDKNQSGSSAMPQKQNPINFENAEGNYHLAETLITGFLDKLQESRLGRDLSDITVMRNIGLIFAYFHVANTSATKGIKSCKVRKLDIKNYNIFAEYITLSLKEEFIKGRYDFDAYKIVKNIFKGSNISTISNLERSISECIPLGVDDSEHMVERIIERIKLRIL